MMHSRPLHSITWILLMIGGLNWLLWGAFGWGVDMYLGGPQATIPRIIFVAVGVSAIYEILSHKNRCRYCEKPGAGSGKSM